MQDFKQLNPKKINLLKILRLNSPFFKSFTYKLRICIQIFIPHTFELFPSSPIHISPILSLESVSFPPLLNRCLVAFVVDLLPRYENSFGYFGAPRPNHCVICFVINKKPYEIIYY